MSDFFLGFTPSYVLFMFVGFAALYLFFEAVDRLCRKLTPKRKETE